LSNDNSGHPRRRSKRRRRRSRGRQGNSHAAGPGQSSERARKVPKTPSPADVAYATAIKRQKALAGAKAILCSWLVANGKVAKFHRLIAERDERQKSTPWKVACIPIQRLSTPMEIADAFSNCGFRNASRHVKWSGGCLSIQSEPAILLTQNEMAALLRKHRTV